MWTSLRIFYGEKEISEAVLRFIWSGMGMKIYFLGLKVKQLDYRLCIHNKENVLNVKKEINR